MSKTTIDLHDAVGKPLGLRVILPQEPGPLLAIWNSWAMDDHAMPEFRTTRYFVRAPAGEYREAQAFSIRQPVAVVERVEP